MRQLKHALVRRQVQTKEIVESGVEMDEIRRILQLAFRNAKDIVINDQVAGFRAHDKEYILLVEVHEPGCSGNYVIKVKDSKKLEEELGAWEACRPDGLRHDLVFMTLDPVREPDGRLAALLYQDAQQFIGVDRTASLEDVFLGSVLYGVPTPESVVNVLTELFARIGHLLYRGASPSDHEGQRITLNGGKTIEQHFDHWDKPGEPQNARRIAIAALPLNQEGFCDPLEFFRFIQDQPESGESHRKFVPRMLRGMSHGDLHGRNVLVGVIDNEAHWPAVFDYEDMRADNLLGWDFVKLETELKIRAYAGVFSDKRLLDYAGNVFRFETTLCQATEDCRRNVTEWPTPAGRTAEERLLHLLLVIRRLAGKHLGDAHNRSAEWLEELYFLLACYGVYGGRFSNLKEIELLGAFMSAGVTAARFAYSRTP
jgi:hypothetical protein